jgi:hypothetical protein
MKDESGIHLFILHISRIPRLGGIVVVILWVISTSTHVDWPTRSPDTFYIDQSEVSTFFSDQILKGAAKKRGNEPGEFRDQGDNV